MNSIEEKFITAVVNETKGDAIAAATIAGYGSPEIDGPKAAKKLKTEIIAALNMALVLQGPRAVMALVAALMDSTIPGTRERIAAARDILDRIGLVKEAKVAVSAPPGIFILPPKQET